jgi:uncharacterized protein YeeX (DUF496 family)
METRSINELNQEIADLQEQVNEQKENVKNERELRQLEIDQIQLYRGIVDEQKHQIASLQSELETYKKQADHFIERNAEIVQEKHAIQKELNDTKDREDKMHKLFYAAVENSANLFSIEQIEQALFENEPTQNDPMHQLRIGIKNKLLTNLKASTNAK